MKEWKVEQRQEAIKVIEEVTLSRRGERDDFMAGHPLALAGALNTHTLPTN
jgi:hypothetical protein